MSGRTREQFQNQQWEEKKRKFGLLYYNIVRKRNLAGRLPNYKIKECLLESKKDVFESLDKISITNPILVDDLIELRNKIKKWFGEVENGIL